MHDEPEQHPSGQLVALQLPVPASAFGIGAHVPALVHCSKEPHALQAWPPEPQKVFAVPLRHTPWVSLQPSHVPPTHVPLASQVAPLAHARHENPEAPQAVAEVPVWHTPDASMQPKQVGFWHRLAAVHA